MSRKSSLITGFTTIVVVLWASVIPVYSQAPDVSFEFKQYDSDLIPAYIYKSRRDSLRKMFTDKSAIVALSNEVKNRINDVDFEYRQHNNLYYLTGSTQPRTALIIIPGGVRYRGEYLTEVFFVEIRQTKKEVWNGVKMGPAEAAKNLGFEKTMDYKQFLPFLDSLLRDRDTIHLAGYPTLTQELPFSEKSFNIEKEQKKELTYRFPRVVIKPTITQIATMREVKDSAELRLMQRAIDISIEGHKSAMRNAKSGMYEYQLEALMEGTFKSLGAEDVGYPSIVGSGINSCMLHYINNRKATARGDLVLMDCGAEYHGYTADITRTFPITGKFNKEQTVLYNLVLEAQDSGIALCRESNSFFAPHQAAMKVISAGLTKLGITKDDSESRWYFMHGTSHYLGLDVHDAGNYGRLLPNSVVTVEPGIYIPSGSPCDPKWWNIGIRIEDDILITTGDPINMSVRLARSIRDIEALMRESSSSPEVGPRSE